MAWRVHRVIDVSLAVEVTDQAIPVSFHNNLQAHRRHGWIPRVCTWNVGALDAAALGFVARYGPHFCVCRRCDSHFRLLAHPFTALPLIQLAHPIPQARDIVADWPRWYGDAHTRNSFFSPISLRPCEVHAPQQMQRDVVLAWRVRYLPRLFPRQRAFMHLLVEPWKHASTRRRFWITC
ncbi:hypothetical protein TcCL_ESM07195 [Trypanosoma cruzi]|nr:hypothetical protein TcCL_ESM07195 [Trypanosoma cruzi]